MAKETVEIADDLDDETKAWLADSEKSLAKTEKKIDSGEIPQEQRGGWDSDNWQTKASGAAPPDIEV